MSEKTDISYLVGNTLPETNSRVCEVYSPTACSFLACLSEMLSNCVQARAYGDIAAFAFWFRERHVQKLKKIFLQANPQPRLGRGLAFTISPGNVPLNFAYSFAFSLLAGNANIVRVPSKNFPQVQIVCEAVKALFSRPEFSSLAARNVFIRYPQDTVVSTELSALCDARIIWGGDQAIQELRKIPVPARAFDLAFADRYSSCVINADFLNDNLNCLGDLADKFYNDTYAMDQNACSSPHSLIWIGAEKRSTEAADKFWEILGKLAAAKYQITQIAAIDKYVKSCLDAVQVDSVSRLRRYGSFLYVTSLKQIPETGLDMLRGHCGFFYEAIFHSLNDLAPYITGKFQTLSYYGFGKQELRDFVLNNRLPGIDRIVPVGQALDMSAYWDGFDLVATLSRVCEIRA